MLARSIFENEFYLYRLARDGSAFVREMVADEVYYRGALGETMFKEEQAREAMGEERRARMRAFIKGLRQESSNAKPLKPKDAISGTDVSAAYAYYQELSFDAGHPSITALNRYVVETTENEIVGLSLGLGLRTGRRWTRLFWPRWRCSASAFQRIKRSTGRLAASGSKNWLQSIMRSRRERSQGAIFGCGGCLEIHRPPLSVLGVGPRPPHTNYLTTHDYLTKHDFYEVIGCRDLSPEREQKGKARHDSPPRLFPVKHSNLRRRSKCAPRSPAQSRSSRSFRKMPRRRMPS